MLAVADEQSVGCNYKAARVVLCQLRKSGIKIVLGCGIYNQQGHPKHTRRRVELSRLNIRVEVGCADERADAFPVGHKAVQQLKPLSAKLSTNPAATGSLPVRKTIGMLVVAALAARTARTWPEVAITETRRLTKSAAKAGNRSFCSVFD